MQARVTRDAYDKGVERELHAELAGEPARHVTLDRQIRLRRLHGDAVECGPQVDAHGLERHRSGHTEASGHRRRRGELDRDRPTRGPREVPHDEAGAGDVETGRRCGDSVDDRRRLLIEHDLAHSDGRAEHAGRDGRGWRAGGHHRAFRRLHQQLLEWEAALPIALDQRPRSLGAYRVDADAFRPRCIDAGDTQPLHRDDRTRPIGEREGTHPHVAAHGELRRRRERTHHGEVGIDARAHAGPDREVGLQRRDVRVLHG